MPSVAWSKRRCASRRSASVPIAGCRTTGTLSCGPNATATSRRSCSGWPTCIPNAGNGQNSALAMGTCIRAGSSRFPSKTTSISTAWCGTLSGMLYGPRWFRGGGLEMGKFAAACAGGARPVTGRVAVARAVRLDRASQHAADGSGIGSPSADAFVAEVLMATSPGPNRQPSNLACNPRYVAVVAHTKAIHKPPVAMYATQYMRLSPLPRPSCRMGRRCQSDRCIHDRLATSRAGEIPQGCLAGEAELQEVSGGLGARPLRVLRCEVLRTSRRPQRGLCDDRLLPLDMRGLLQGLQGHVSMGNR